MKKTHRLLILLMAAVCLLASCGTNGKVSDGKSEGVMTYEEYVAAEIDSDVTVETYIQGADSWWDGKITLYTQDEDGGYFIYEMPCAEDEAEKLVPGTKIKVTGKKSEWEGEIEITDASFEIEEGSYIAEAKDVTDLLGKDDLINSMNQFVMFKGLTVEASKDTEGNEVPFLYKWDGTGKDGDDVYFNVSKDGKTYSFLVRSYLTGPDTDVYKAAKALNIGDTIDCEGFLYWYEGVNPHITSISNANGDTKDSNVTEDIPEHETPSMEEMKEINHKIYVANTREELLKKHKSISYSYEYDYPKNEDLVHYYYITADYQYEESDELAAIVKDRMEYELSGRLNADGAEMTYTFDLSADPGADLFQYVPATEDGWMDYDHDTFTDCYTQDGRIHLFSEMDEVASEYYAANNICEDYKGQTYSQEAIVDAETYEFLVDYVYRNKDGKQELISTQTMEYDIPESAACSIMRAVFERKAENMMTVTFVADPDTEQEIEVSAEIPANNQCEFMIDDSENIAIYTDRECTKQATEHWDRMSDRTYYIKHTK